MKAQSRVALATVISLEDLLLGCVGALEGKREWGWGAKVCSPHILRTPWTAVHCVHWKGYLGSPQPEEDLL